MFMGFVCPHNSLINVSFTNEIQNTKNKEQGFDESFMKRHKLKGSCREKGASCREKNKE
jgi:hypothetical protein